MDPIYANIALSGFTALSTILGGYWTYRVKQQALRNQLEIARLHDCLDASVQTQRDMHHANQPIMLATLRGVNEIKAKQDGE